MPPPLLFSPPRPYHLLCRVLLCCWWFSLLIFLPRLLLLSSLPRCATSSSPSIAFVITLLRSSFHRHCSQRACFFHQLPRCFHHTFPTHSSRFSPLPTQSDPLPLLLLPLPLLVLLVDYFLSDAIAPRREEMTASETISLSWSMRGVKELLNTNENKILLGTLEKASL